MSASSSSSSLSSSSSHTGQYTDFQSSLPSSKGTKRQRISKESLTSSNLDAPCQQLFDNLSPPLIFQEEVSMQKLKKNRNAAFIQQLFESPLGFRISSRPSIPLSFKKIWPGETEEKQHTIHTEFHRYGAYEAAIASCQSWRPTMEDAHLATQINFENIHREHGQINAILYAVCDGHGHQYAGTKSSYKASDFVINSLKEALEEEFKTFRETPLNDPIIRETLKSTVKRISDAYNYYYYSVYGALASVDGALQDGTTLIACLVIDNKIWTINVGDSRAFIVYPHTITQLSEDAKLTGRYLDTIQKLGGTVTYQSDVPRVEACYPWNPQTPAPHLALAKAIGDQWVPGISPIPKITCHELADRAFLVLCCDGFTDGASTKEGGDAIASMAANRLSVSEMAVNLVYSVVRLRHSSDNVSVIVAQLPFEKVGATPWVPREHVYYPQSEELRLDHSLVSDDALSSLS